MLGHLRRAAIRYSSGESCYYCIRFAQGQPVAMVERASLETAKSFERAPVRATVRPVQSILPYSEAQASPALSNAVPSLHSLSRSQVVLPVRDPISSFVSES